MDSSEDIDDNSKQFSDDLSDDETLVEGLLANETEVKGKTCFQKEIHDLKLLPYADEIEKEADTLFTEIKYNLGRYIMLRDLDNITEYWYHLVRYIKLFDLRFTKEDHISLIKLIYEFMTIPNLKSLSVVSSGWTLIMLLRKSDLISPNELELPWRPLYELCNNTINKTAWNIPLQINSPSLKTVLEKVIYAAKIYFPANATQEILDELRSGICAFNYGVTRTSIKMLEWFLPTMMTPDRHEQGFKLWFDELLTLWKNCTMLSIASSLLHLFSDLAYYNVGYIDWEPYIPLMFTKFVQSFGLPVNYKNISCRSNLKLSPRRIGIWIASALGGNSSVQAYLDKFLKTVETYFHPANYGNWLHSLEELFLTLSNVVVVRLYKERYQKNKSNNPRWNPPTPESHKLTDADVDAFVNSMMQIVTIGIYNKRCHDLFEALSYLAITRPNIVIPVVLEKVYPTLGFEIEPHKQIIAFNCMIAIARPMVLGSRHIEKEYAFQEGQLYILPLLFTALAGIDPNDQNKCLATFRLIQIYVSMIPIVDCSKSSAVTSEDERLVCEDTSRFEDFVLQLMSKVFTLIESSTFESVRLESTRSNVKSQSHSKFEMELNFLFLTLLRQSSPSLRNFALFKLRSFILESTLEIQVSGRLVATLCEVFAQVHGPETLKALMPFISERFHECIDEDDAFKAEHLNNQILFPLLLLSRLVLTQGDVLLPHEDTVLDVIDKAIHLKSLEGNELGCVLLSNTLQALANVNPINVERNLDDSEYPHTRDWGVTSKIKRIKFYVPGDNEVAALERIFKRYFVPVIAAIEKFIETGNSLSRDDLERTLRILSYILKGCNGFLPVWSEPPLQMKRMRDKKVFEAAVGFKGEIKMPDGSNVRYFLARLISRLQEVMMAKVEDDTKSFFQLIVVWQYVLFGKIFSETSFKYLTNFHNSMYPVKYRLTGCKGWFVTYKLARVYMLQGLRRQSADYPTTETHKSILLNLFKLSISHYPGVRIKSQDAILNSLMFFGKVDVILLPDIIEVLQRDPTAHHDAFKGILYLLIGQASGSDCLMISLDWEFTRKLWPAIASSRSSEKPSIVRLKKAIAEALRDYYSSVNLRATIPDSTVSAAEKLWDTGLKLIEPKPSEEEMNKGIENLRKIEEENFRWYNEIMDELLIALVDKNKIWNDRLVSMNFMYVLLNDEVIVSAPTVRFFLNSLLHDTIHERKAALRVLTTIMKQLKKKYPKIEIENPSISEYSSLPGPIKPGSRPDNAWLQYNRETCPTSQADWDEPRYVNKINTGYYAWPRKLKVCAPSAKQSLFDRSTYKEQDLEIIRFFEETLNVDKLIEYLSLEGKKVLEKFDDNRRIFFKSLFRNYGDSFLPHFLPHLRRLVVEKQNASQRCAAEIIAGIVQGSKHWTYDMVARMWEGLLPILRKAMSNLTGEFIVHWQACMVRICMQRDPKRLHWLLEFLLEETPKEQSVEASIVQYGRIMILQSAIVPIAWKSVDLLHRTLKYLESRIEQRIFRTVRDALVTTLNLILNENLQLTTVSDEPNGTKFIDKFYPKVQSLLEKDATALQDSSTSAMETEQPNGIDLERENTVRLFKTICMWIYCASRTSFSQNLSSFYKMLPLMCQLENDDKDEELSKICTQSIAALAHTVHRGEHIPSALESVRLVCQSDSWSSRANCLEFLQVLVFHNMSLFLSNEGWIRDVQNVVVKCLEDERLEVREKSAKLLGGLLHCNVIPDQEALLEEFKKKTRTKLVKKKKVVNCPKAARVRHASILGMCAFILAYPYDIPKHVPPIFECLSFHLNDPEPIPTTIHKTVNEFKRTHTDGLAEKFTEEQFAVLQDLTVPPSYIV
ncbi:proteasome activator complex subunit 4B [Copidosoma floridanum]|uniref:proteasome activator complex subunit 4B n=1 Tax=Copidosoma floridanum TaxID=29053 RepID=UPI0006C94A5C|nr:proteasome activator complex subunit 4B [Copidosoma floridanum]XP_014204671.1 proteasome activator complex subunit 4B [Copidosoma floridanum]XP_014204672.1 proteasome activator complex subunit 4B [Copidosoma floridanum]